MRQVASHHYAFRRAFFAAASVSLLVVSAPVAMAKQKLSDSTNSAANDWRTPYVEGERKLKTQELEAAEAAFSEALRRVNSNKNSSPDDISLCYQSLASAHYMRDRFYEFVVPLYKKAISTLEKAYGRQSPKLVTPLAAYAAVREDEGDYKAASKLLTRARTLIEKADGKSSLVYADNLHRLGRVNWKLGFSRKAEEMYYESLTVVMQQKVLPSSDVVEQQLSDYIDLLTKAENPGKALDSSFQKELLKDSVSSFERAQGVSASTFNKEVSGRLAPDRGATGERILPDDQAGGWSQSAGSSSTTGTSFSAAINPDRPMTDFAALEEINKQRVAFYERMISTDILSLGQEHPSVARDLSGLAQLYLSQKKYAEAKPLLLKALAIYEKSYTSESNMIKRTQELLRLIEEQQNPHPTLVLGRPGALSSLPEVPLAAQKLEIALRLNKLAFLNYSQGKLPQAEKIYAWAVASTVKSAGEQSLLTATSLMDYSRALRSNGKQAEAETMDGSAQDILRRSISQNAMRALP